MIHGWPPTRSASTAYLSVWGRLYATTLGEGSAASSRLCTLDRRVDPGMVDIALYPPELPPPPGACGPARIDRAGLRQAAAAESPASARARSKRPR